jgi:cytoskeletal protein RodZ
MGEFGDKFRKAREKKELSLDDVSNVTKISSRMLQAIEQEHFDLLPGGVFNKGFIRAYAKHLGMDPEDAVTDYLATLRQAQIDAHEVWEPQPPVPSRVPAPKSRAPVVEQTKSEPKPQPPVQVEELPELHLPRIQDVNPSRKEFLSRGDRGSPRILIASAVVVIAFAAFLWTRHSRSQRAATPAPPSSQQAAVPNPQPSPVTPASAAPVGSANLSGPSSKPASTQSAPATPAAPATGSGAKGSPDPPEGNDVTVRTFGKTDPKPKAKGAVTKLSLIIRATETSWISVQADGQLVTEETLIAPAYYSVHAGREIQVRVGNAAGVSFVFNGKEVAAQGNASEAKTVVFDSSGMKIAP